MAAKLVITPEVEGDIDETYAWYEQRRIGLGEEFLGSVEACIARLSRSPKMHPLIHETYRRGLLRRFPYAVFYEYADRIVTVFAVFHASRDPEKWRRRLP